MKALSIEVPRRTKNITNERTHWRVKAKAAKAERAAVARKLPKAKTVLAPLLEVRLTRLSAGELDDDGLRAALKGVRDGVASWLRVDDSTPLVRWSYAQGPCPRGEGSVRIEVESMGGGMPVPLPFPEEAEQRALEALAQLRDRIREDTRRQMEAWRTEALGPPLREDETVSERVKRLATPNIRKAGGK